MPAGPPPSRCAFSTTSRAELSAGQLAALDAALGLSGTGNNEILFLWLEMALENRYEPAVPQVETFLAEVGRAKFVRPLFQVLWNEGDWGRPIATRIYAQDPRQLPCRDPRGRRPSDERGRLASPRFSRCIAARFAHIVTRRCCASTNS